MRNYDLVIFDMDGTLVDSDAIHYNLFGQFWKLYFPHHFGKDIMRNGKGKTILETLRGGGIGPEECEDIFDKLDIFYQTKADETIGTMRFIENTRETIEQLRENGVQVAMVSNSMEVLVTKVIEANHAQDLFITAVGANREAKDKTDRFKAVLQHTGIAPERALYVGDAELDVTAAHTCHMDCCILYSSFAWLKSIESLLKDYDPDYIVKDIRKISKIVL